MATPSDEALTIDELVSEILERAVPFVRRGPLWSTCELRITEEEIRQCQNIHRTSSTREWLRQESKNYSLPGNQVLSPIEQIAFLVLAVGAEVVRRDSTEGQAWPEIYDFFCPGFKHLFISNKNPTADLKEAMRSVAFKMRLRHRFGDDDAQQWLDTIYLQFGFTLKGMSNLGGRWLAGFNRPQSIIELLNGPNSSDDFRTLWSVLRSYRKNPIEETGNVAKRVLRNNSWVLAEWVQELLEASVRNRNIVDKDLDNTSLSGETRSSTRPEIQRHRVSWDVGSNPCVELPVSWLCDIADGAPSYRLYISNEQRGRLVQTSSGDYTFYAFDHQPNPEWLQLPLSQNLLVELKSESDNDEPMTFSHRIDVWDASEDVNVLRLERRVSVNAWEDKIDVERRFALVVAAGCEVNPKPAAVRRIDTIWTAYRLDAGWSRETRVILNGEEYWAPQIDIRGQEAPQSQLSQQCSKYCRTEVAQDVRWGLRFRIQVTHPDQTTCSVMWEGKWIPCINVEGTTTASVITDSVSEPIRCPVLIQEFERPLRLRVSQLHGLTDRPHFCVVPFRLTSWGAAYEGPAGALIPIDANEDFNVALARKGYIKVGVVHDYHPGSWRIRHSNRFDITYRQFLSTDKLDAWGAPLKLTHKDERDKRLCRIVDRGKVQDVQIDDGIVCVELADRMEHDDHHGMVILTDSGPLWVDALNDVTDQDKYFWLAEIPKSMKPWAVGIRYGNSRIGAWWTQDWAQRFRTLPHDIQAECAMILAWLRLPILDERHSKHVLAAVEACPGRLIRSLLKEHSMLTDTTDLTEPLCSKDQNIGLHNLWQMLSGFTLPYSDLALAIIKLILTEHSKLKDLTESLCHKDQNVRVQNVRQLLSGWTLPHSDLEFKLMIMDLGQRINSVDVESSETLFEACNSLALINPLFVTSALKRGCQMGLIGGDIDASMRSVIKHFAESGNKDTENPDPWLRSLVRLVNSERDRSNLLWRVGTLWTNGQNPEDAHLIQLVEEVARNTTACSVFGMFRALVTCARYATHADEHCKMESAIVKFDPLLAQRSFRSLLTFEVIEVIRRQNNLKPIVNWVPWAHERNSWLR